MSTPAAFVHKLCVDLGLTSGWTATIGFMPEVGTSPQRCIGFYDYGNISHGRTQQDGVVHRHNLVQVLSRGVYPEAYSILDKINTDLSKIYRGQNILVTIPLVPSGFSIVRFDSFVYRSGPLHLARLEKFNFHEFSLNSAVKLNNTL